MLLVEGSSAGIGPSLADGPVDLGGTVCLIDAELHD